MSRHLWPFNPTLPNWQAVGTYPVMSLPLHNTRTETAFWSLCQIQVTWHHAHHQIRMQSPSETWPVVDAVPLIIQGIIGTKIAPTSMSGHTWPCRLGSVDKRHMRAHPGVDQQSERRLLQSWLCDVGISYMGATDTLGDKTVEKLHSLAQSEGAIQGDICRPF